MMFDIPNENIRTEIEGKFLHFQQKAVRFGEKCGTASVVPKQNSMKHEIDTEAEKTQKKKNKEKRNLFNL